MPRATAGCFSLGKINISESALPAAKAGKIDRRKYTEGASVFRVSEASPCRAHLSSIIEVNVEFAHTGENVVYLTKLPAGVSRLELIPVNRWALDWGMFGPVTIKILRFLPVFLVLLKWSKWVWPGWSVIWRDGLPACMWQLCFTLTQSMCLQFCV